MSSRRNFFKITGTALSAPFLTPGSLFTNTSATDNPTIKVGVLLSNSSEHPFYPDSFLKGLRLAGNILEEKSKNKVELIIENVGSGTTSSAQTAVNRLISENNVSLIVGLLGNEVAYRIGETLKTNKVPALVSNAGENFTVTGVRDNLYLFFNTLNLFEASYSAGKYMVSEYGKNIGIITSEIDSGYDSLFAFIKGVETGGGKVSETFVLKPGVPASFEAVIQNIEQFDGNGLYVLLNGKQSDQFFRVVKRRKPDIPLMTTSFAMDDQRIISLGNVTNGIRYFGAWTKGINTPENSQFIESFQRKYNQIPNQFGFLGYQAGLVVNNSIAACDGYLSKENIRAGIEESEVLSPAGKISVVKESGLFKSPVFLCQTQLSRYNVPESSVLENYASDKNLTEAFSSLDSNLRSGYINPYLFG